MSISDAGELERRVVGGETDTPQYRTAGTPTATAREQQDETFKQQKHRDDETPTGQQCHPTAIRQEDTLTALISKAERLKEEEAAHCAESKVQSQKPIEQFTSCLQFRLSRNPELNHSKELAPCLHSLTETQRTETKNSNHLINGTTSPPDSSIKVACESPLSERISFPAKKREEAITVLCNELEATKDFSITQSFSNREFGPHGCNGLHIPCGPQPRTNTISLELEEDIKGQTKLERLTDFGELSNTKRTMLSSTVVTVLAPHWNGRLRRTKRPEGPGNSEGQGNLQDVTNTAANRAHERFQDTMDRPLSAGSQAQSRVPCLGTRRNTVGWSTKSGLASLDYESKRKMIHTVSLDVNSGRMDNRKMDASSGSPVPRALSPLSPLSIGQNEQRMNQQTGHQVGLSSLSSKPTTSSLLLSLRRINSNGRNSNADSSPQSSLTSDRDGKVFATHLSQTFLNDNGQDRSKSLLSPSPVSYRTSESGPAVSPLSSNQRERNTYETRFFSPSFINKDMEKTPFSQQPQSMNRTQYTEYPSKVPSEMRENWRGSDKSTNIFPESSASSPRPSQYDPSALFKTHSLPRRTTLTSTSWWKQVNQEGSSPLALNDEMSIKGKTDTTLVPPCNNNTNLASTSPTDNRRFIGQTLNNRFNNTTRESVHKGNMNLAMMTQERTPNLKQRNAGDSPERESHRLDKQQYGSHLDNRESRKLQSLPDVVTTSKMSRPTGNPPLSYPKDLIRHNVNNSLFTTDVTDLPPTLLDAKSPNTPTESSRKFNNNHCTSKTNTTPTFSQNKNSQKFNKPPLSLATTNILNSQELTSTTTFGLPLTPNNKTISSFQSDPVGSQTNIGMYYTGSSQPPKFPNPANATPLGFERLYAFVQKPLHPETVSSLFLTGNANSKTHCSPVSTDSTSFPFTTGSHPSARAAPNPSVLTPIATPAITSSPIITVSSLLTPPATPFNTSPSFSETSSPKEGREFLSSPESDPKKLRPRVEGKRVRRVTWEDSVDLKDPEPITSKKPELSQVPKSPLSVSSSPQSLKNSSVFSFLRSSNPTTNTPPLCSHTPKTSGILVVKGGKYRSLSSDSADSASREQKRFKQRPCDSMILDPGRQDSTTPRPERTLSVESGPVHCRSSAPLSLPPDFSSGYKLRYSAPPYSSLMSSRSTQGEAKTIIPRSPLFPQSQPYVTPHLSMRTDPVAATTFPTSKPPLSPVRQPQPPPLPFQNKTATPQGSTKCGVSETYHVNFNSSKNNSQDYHNGQILLIDNRFHEGLHSSSPCVTETLVYSVKSKADRAVGAPQYTTPNPVQHTAVSVETKLSQQSHRGQSKEVTREQRGHSPQSSSDSSSTESQPPSESSNRRVKDNVLGKSKNISMEGNNEQSPKRSRFALKKSVSTPNSSLHRSESERASKTNNKMDKVLSKLKERFSYRLSDDDVLFPWKWKRASQTPSVSGSSDISDITIESTPKLTQQEQDKGMLLGDNGKGTEGINRWTPNRCTLRPPSGPGNIMAGGDLCIWSDMSHPETDQKEQNAFGEHSNSQNKPKFSIQSLPIQLDFNEDSGADSNSTNQYLSCRSPNASTDHPTQLGRSASSPRSPFSPFSSLSPVSPFASQDVSEDNVFYSPKLQRRRDTPSPCEQGGGISLGGSRRSRASIGPPSAGPGQDEEGSASSYADLKYGIEPGRSFSVSSVLSSRPSGPGRISTGSRFMSVGDLSESALTCEGKGKDLDQWSVHPDRSTEKDCQPSKDCRMSYLASDPGKMRSRSLPRSLTRRLANWSSEVPVSPSVTTTTSKQARLWSPNMNTCHFAWTTEGPPTPPPTPPLSPVSRRISQPPSLSSPTYPGSSGASMQVDSQSSKGLRPSRGYETSLSTFEESTDSSSDTTTDDEYYLETGEDEEKEKETEL
ncbi:mucin-17 [Notothenia coriiceps]|uniref:Mucin-17 n=1 Tax=Notothenia coriiceps TaxID=8208 RepID=A0A6I9MLS0_9TELE|nr:PREDICTED: mucin-17-like [Notothenia coriiceps]